MSFIGLFGEGKDAVRSFENCITKLEYLKSEVDSCDEHAEQSSNLLDVTRANPDLRIIETSVLAWQEANNAYRVVLQSDPNKQLLTTGRIGQTRADAIIAIKNQLLLVLKSLYAALKQSGLQQSVDLVYHSTTAGKNSEQLIRFFQIGASAMLSNDSRKQNTWTGQTPGFYVWRSLALARKHAIEMVDCPEDELRAVIALPYGSALDWGIDAEVNCARLSIFLAAHVRELQAIPDGTLHINDDPIFTTKCELLRTGVLRVRCGNSMSNISPGTIDNNIGIARKIGALYEGMRQIYPQVTEPFQHSLLGDASSAAAIVYRGTHPLPVLSAEVFLAGNWIDARSVIDHPVLLKLKE